MQLLFAMLVSCAEPDAKKSPPDEVPTDTGAIAPTTTTDSPDYAETGATGDTATHWEGLYPPAPFDCSAGVPEGPYDWRSLKGVATTEDFVFDLDGYMVASDYAGNVIRYLFDGTGEAWAPGAGENRGFELLPDGDVLMTDPNSGTLVRLERGSGAPSLFAAVNVGASDLDIDADGGVFAGNLSTGQIHYVNPKGKSVVLGRPSIQTYGAALSPDEQRLYITSYSPGDPSIFVLDRKAGDAWTEPVSWVTLPTAAAMGGAATDVCGNVYTVDALTCEVWRVSPAGDLERILDIPGGSLYCPNLGFGRTIGGWDPYKLYVSTYDDVVEVDLGVPGRER